jgi:hypothetical protein
MNFKETPKNQLFDGLYFGNCRFLKEGETVRKNDYVFYDYGPLGPWRADDLVINDQVNLSQEIECVFVRLTEYDQGD